MNKKIEILQNSDIYGPNFNQSEIGRPIFSWLGFGRSLSDFFPENDTTKSAIILLSKVMMPPSEAIMPTLRSNYVAPFEALSPVKTSW